MRTLRAIPTAVAKGFSEWKTLLVLLGVTLVCGLIAVVPDVGMLWRYYGHAPLAEGKPLASVELLLSLSQAFPHGAGPLRVLGVSLLVALPLTLFVTGGVVWRSWTVDRFGLVEFTVESARMFGRVVRTLLFSLLLLAPCIGLVAGTSALLHAAHRDSVFTSHWYTWVLDRPFHGWAVAQLGLVAVLWALWRLTLDTSRVLVLVEELRQTRLAVWRALRMVVRSPGAWAGYLLLGVAEVLAVLLMMRLHAALPEGNTALAVLAFLVAQLVLLVRAGFQVSTTAFAAELVRRARTVALPAVATAPVVEAGTTVAGAAGTAEVALAEGEPFELLSDKELPRTGSTSEMPLVDADLVEDEPPSGGGSGPR